MNEALGRGMRLGAGDTPRILFIVPPNITFADFMNPAQNESYHIKLKSTGQEIKTNDVRTDMPLGVLSMSSYIKKAIGDVQVELIDFNTIINKLTVIDFSSFCELFSSELQKLDFQPNIVGLSALFAPQYENLILLAQCCHEKFPNSFICAGGGVPSNMYREVFEETSAIDAICYGEGEIPMVELCLATDIDEYISSSVSWITRSKMNSAFAPTQKFIEDLDDIPFLDYNLCNIDDYSINPAAVAHSPVARNSTNFHVMTSRGCPNLCCFCSSHSIHGRQMRYYSLDRVREDWNRLKTEFGAKTLVVQDDHLMGSKERALRVVKTIKELGLKAIFQNGLALFALDREFLAALKDAGVNDLTLSVESGSERVLKKIMHKPLSHKIIQRVVGDCRQLGIHTTANIIIGLPGETIKDIDDAVSFLSKLDVNWFMIFSATPLPGSEMFDTCLQKGYIQRSGYTKCNFKKAVISTKDFSAAYILEKTYLMNLELNFVHNPDIRLKDFPAAIANFQRVLRAKADHALAYFMLGICHEQLVEFTAAQSFFERAKSILASDASQRKLFMNFALELQNYKSTNGELILSELIG